MRKLKEALRLKFGCNLSNRQVAAAVGISASSVSYYCRAFKQSGLSWPLDEQLDDEVLVAQLEPHCQQLRKPVVKKILLDYAKAHEELQRKGMTLELLWQEYKAVYGKRAYSYSETARQYRMWRKRLKAVYRQTYVGGDKCMVDYAGPKLSYLERKTHETVEVNIFVGVLAASNFTYAEATLTRTLPDWLGSHTRMLTYFGGVPDFIIPDNEKSSTHKACRYDPELNPSYANFAEHYQTTILPTRPGKPRDKAKVETAVQIIERYIMRYLRHRQFYSLGEINEAIRDLLEKLNNKPLQKLTGTRLIRFEKLDKPHLKPLPNTPYEFVLIKRAKVALDYHVTIDKHAYSVPHKLIGKTVDYRLTRDLVEVYYQGKRVASHLRAYQPGEYTTQAQHMPHVHRAHQQWTPKVFLHWGGAIRAAYNPYLSTHH